jgi:hypothetical protein
LRLLKASVHLADRNRGKEREREKKKKEKRRITIGSTSKRWLPGRDGGFAGCISKICQVCQNSSIPAKLQIKLDEK